MTRVFIGIGSNQGDREANLSRAVQLLRGGDGIRLVSLAPIYETEPVGPPQEKFLNTAIELETALEPAELLRQLKRIERELGRTETAQRWGPREIDLDILLYGNRVVQEPSLTIPHPELHRRRFALEPLAQLAPTLVHPVLKRTIQELLEGCA